MSKSVQLFGKMLTFSRIKISTDNLQDIRLDLLSLIELGSSVTGIPVVIDSDVDLALDELLDLLHSLDISPIGVVDGVLSKKAKSLRLAILPADGKRMERIEPKPQKSEPPSQKAVDDTPNDTPSTTSTSSTYAQMLRSGQSMQHFGGDLTIIGGVNQGAEAITDHSLHIYGHGLGRLVAGATGDKDARIFCQKFNPTLVSVAGTYCLSEDIPADVIDKAVQVSFDENQGLVFSLIE